MNNTKTNKSNNRFKNCVDTLKKSNNQEDDFILKADSNIKSEVENKLIEDEKQTSKLNNSKTNSDNKIEKEVSDISNSSHEEKNVLKKKSYKNNSFLDELFPEDETKVNLTRQIRSFRLADYQWKKIQEIAQRQNISCNEVVSRILDKALF